MSPGLFKNENAPSENSGEKAHPMKPISEEESSLRSEMHKLKSLAETLTKVPWNDIEVVQSDNMYFQDPDDAIFEEMVDQCVSVLLIRILAILEDRDRSSKDITREVLDQLHAYVSCMLRQYRGVYYHSSEHGLHVVLCANKLLHLLLYPSPSDEQEKDDEEEYKEASYGIRSDPLMQLAFIFSALIHDVDHLGITNRQLVTEEHNLAILYNDQSVLENRSLTVGFSEFLKEDYKELRELLFRGNDYVKFRRIVIDLVLCTDIASPERMQLTKSMFKEAFGETSEQKELKMLKSIREQQKKGGKEGGNAVEAAKRLSLYQQSGEIKPAVFRPGVSKKKLSAAAENEEGLKQEDDGYASSDLSSEDSVSLESHGDSTDSYISFSPSVSSEEEDSEEEQEEPSEKEETHQDSSSGGANTEPCRRNSFKKEDINQVSTKSVPEKKSSRPRLTVSKYASERFSSRAIEEPKPIQKQSSNRRSSRISRSSQPQMTVFAGRGLDRRLSLPASIFGNKAFEYRLGIRRALDFSGLAVSSYIDGEPSKTIDTNKKEKNKNPDEDGDSMDPLKAQVVLQIMIRAADVGPTMQSFKNFTKWGRRLYFEQKHAYAHNRGVDPDSFWLKGQITFLDSYAMDLARRLKDVKAFKRDVADKFVENVVSNKKIWEDCGVLVTESTVRDWNEEWEHMLEKDDSSTAKGDDD